MFDLFKPKITTSNPIRRFIEFDYFKARMTENILTMRKAYMTHSVTVSNSHILVRLIKQLMSAHIDNLERFLTIVEENSTTVAKQLKIATASSPPEFNLQERILPHVKHELLFINNDDSLFFKQPKWFNVKPIKILYHSETKYDFALLSKGLDDEGYVVIEIDTLALLYMYRGWLFWQRRINPGEQETIGQFVAKWVIPTLLESYFDFAFFNNFVQKWKGTYEPIQPRKVIKALPDHTKYFDKILDDLVELFLRREFTLEEVLINIPSLNHDNLLQAFSLPDIPPTRYGSAIKLASRLNIIESLLDIDELYNTSKNRLYKTQIQRTIRQAKSERWLDVLQKNEKVGDLTNAFNLVDLYTAT